MIIKINRYINATFKNPIFKNSSWGVIAQLSQSIFLSLFFVIIARIYSTPVFANYIVVTVLYQLITAISSLGLSQWFIREMAQTSDRNDLVSRFFKIQFYLGLFFYIICVTSAYLIYDDSQIYYLAILLGLNIVFDNLINAIRCLNVANFEQKKTFVILTIESIIKFLTACVLFIYPFSIVVLIIVLIITRFISLNLFLAFGSSKLVSLKKLINYKVYFKDVRDLVLLNWPFIIIGGVSIINWRISTIIISKVLSAMDIANYEISYKLFSIAQILPVIISTSVFPALIKLYNEGDREGFRHLYRKVHIYYLLFGLFSYTFIYCFADLLLPFGFGSNYSETSVYTKQMFLTILVFPTALLQANILIAMKLEKADMILNIIILIINASLCLFGLYFIKSLAVVNFSIFIAFLVFHVLQDWLLVKKRISSLRHLVEFYSITLLTIILFKTASRFIEPMIIFLIYWISIGVYFWVRKNKLTVLSIIKE